jgi:hypothetical protein
MVLFPTLKKSLREAAANALSMQNDYCIKKNK